MPACLAAAHRPERGRRQAPGTHVGLRSSLVTPGRTRSGRQQERKYSQDVGEDANQVLQKDLQAKLEQTSQSAEKYELKFQEAQKIIMALKIGIQVWEGGCAGVPLVSRRGLAPPRLPTSPNACRDLTTLTMTRRRISSRRSSATRRRCRRCCTASRSPRAI